MPNALYNPNDSTTGRHGGTYLDLEEAKEAEKRRAAVEGRAPNFDNIEPTAGIPLVSAAQILATNTVNNLPSIHADPLVRHVDTTPLFIQPTEDEIDAFLDEEDADKDEEATLFEIDTPDE